MPDLILALFLAAAVSTVSLSSLVGIAIFAIADRHGGHRCGRRRRVRSERTTVSSRGHRPYRGGRVRLS